MEDNLIHPFHLISNPDLRRKQIFEAHIDQFRKQNNPSRIGLRKKDILNLKYQDNIKTFEIKIILQVQFVKFSLK